eukprot:jgi/Galph1/4844/GphlegSOOS_G3469.1
MDSPLFYCQQFDLASPLVNRQQAVLQVLEAFSDSYDKSDPKKLRGVRPVVCFAGHMYGAGKTTFGVRFNEFLVINKEFISQARSKQRLPGCATPEESLDALYNKTLFVYLSLKEFPQKGTDFAYSFAERICKAALSEFPNSQGLLSEVLPLIPQGPSKWLRKLMRVINKKYLYLFLDEIGYLGVKDYFQFSDLRSPSSNEDSSNVYPTFFRILSNLFPAVYVLCIVAGRSDAIVRRQEDAMPSRIDLRFLRLDPFSSDIVKDIVQLSRYGEETLREIIFPKTPQGIDWLSEIVWDYTGGVPIYVHYVLSELAKMFVSNPQWQDLSKEELREMVETIQPRPALFVSIPNMRPKTVAVFSSMLLASVLEIPLRPEETYFRGMNLGLYSTYALDIANSFGFYYSYGDSTDTFKVVYPKIVLKYLEKYCGDIPMFRFISHLFSTTTPSDSPLSRVLTFQVLFSLVLYLKLYFCSKLGEINIFQKTFVEDYRFHNVDYIQRRKRIPLPQYVASFSSTVCEVTATGLTHHPNAWNLFYDRFLSRKDAGQGIGLSHIKNETEKFLIPVAQQLDLEANNMAVIQVIVSTKYTKEVTRQFIDHQNWILNSGTYENDNGHICLQSLSSPPACDSNNEWLSIPQRCQLVVCSTTGLQSFLGTEAYSQLEQVFKNEDVIQSASKLAPVSSALTSWLQKMLIDGPTEV